MKKIILAIAAVAVFTFGKSFAQSGYSSKGHPAPVASSSRYDNSRNELSVYQLDAVVQLSHKQKNEIKRIENRYDKLMFSSRKPQSPQSIQRLEYEKQQDILSVLTRSQLQHWVAYQNTQKPSGRNFYHRRG